jgi:ParB-like chromosome segregation protein Spo0J
MTPVSMAAEQERTIGGARGASGLLTMRLSALQVLPSLREDTLREHRIEALLAAPDAWAPILVRRADLTIVDGQHRIAAARRLDRTEIEAELFDGDAEAAFLEFVQRHARLREGLNRRERRSAARRVLDTHREWSDRRIAELCGISPKTVAELRRELPEVDGEEAGDVRVGRDGRARPVDAAARRALIVAALRERPDASLRAIARTVGVSPETVRSVRTDLGRTSPPRPVLPPPTWRPAPEPEPWQPDAAFLSREDSAATAAFFERTDVCDAELNHHVRTIPLSRVYEVADEARRRAAFWLRLAQSVESQAERATPARREPVLGGTCVEDPR